MKVIVFEDMHAVDRFVVQRIKEVIESKSCPVIGFATGSTPQGVYNGLIQKYQKGEVSFRQVKAFNLDEYVGLSKDHPRSFAKAMWETLFSKLDIEEENIYALNGVADNMEQECQRYEKLIQENPIDLQLLGIGMDGHIAYNEPGTSFDEGCHVTNLHKESIESSLGYGFDHLEEVPRQGVTQGISTIMQARELIMIAKGEKKAKLVQRMVKGKVSEDFPSSIIQNHNQVLVVLDQEAASHLEEEDYERH